MFAPRGHRNDGPPNSTLIAGAVSLASIPSRALTASFARPALGPSGIPQRRWLYTIAGGRPELGGTTAFEAPIVPVSLDLLDYDGSVRVVNGHRLHYSVEPFVNAVMNSPIFQRADYSSSEVPTQFSDAVQRAEFNNVMRYDWHTLLKPALKPARTLSIPRGVILLRFESRRLLLRLRAGRY